jgi:hypothetical protein
MMRVLLLFVFLALYSLSFGQDDLMDDLMSEAESELSQDVIATFKSTYLINANTIEMVKANTLDFRITHRFGNIGGAAGGGVHTLYGFDVAQNVRFSFDFGISDKWMIGFGRSKTKEHLDFSTRYKLMQQSKTKPVTMVWFSGMGLTPMRNIDSRYDQFLHRLSFAHQVIIARKFNKKLSLEILPTYMYRNQVDLSINTDNNAQDENGLFAMGMAGRYKLGSRVSIVAEYFYNFSEFRQSNSAMPYYNHFGLGVEVETGGHVFHLNLTNSSGIILNDFLADTPDAWGNGGFKFGFNISRVFNIGK